jgi:hypothetical protein
LDVEQVLGLDQLGGRMTRGGQFQFIRRDAMSVVCDFDQRTSRIPNRNGNIFCACIQ